jgi:hypothetical protein
VTGYPHPVHPRRSPRREFFKFFALCDFLLLIGFNRVVKERCTWRAKWEVDHVKWGLLLGAEKREIRSVDR